MDATAHQSLLQEIFELPFTRLEDSEYRQIISGPRVSSGHSHPKAYYGPITIRTGTMHRFSTRPGLIVFGLLTGNYIAGSVKKALRTSKLLAPCNAVFLDLPIELQLMVPILYAPILIGPNPPSQVLEHLHPIDLYHFSQTSKSLRQIIMNPVAIGVWKTAFARHPDLPTCHPLVRESKWSFMLFGPGICVVGGCSTAMNFDPPRLLGV